MYTSTEHRSNGPRFGATPRATASHFALDIEDGRLVSPAEQSRREDARRLQEIADEQHKKLTRARALDKVAEKIAEEMIARAQGADTPATPLTEDQLARHEQVKKSVKAFIKDSEQRSAAGLEQNASTGAATTTTAKSESQGHKYGAGDADTIPSRLVIDSIDIPERESSGGGNGGFNNPSRFGGGGSGGRDNSSLSVSPTQWWMFGFAAVLCILIAFLVIGVKRDLYKDYAIQALSLAKSTKAEVNAIAGDISFGVERLAITNKRVAEITDTVIGTTTIVQSISKDMSDTKEDLQRTKNAVKILADAVVDPQLLANNATKVAMIEGDIKSLKRNDAKLAAGNARANAGVDQVSNAVAGVRVEIDTLKDQVATLSKVVIDSAPGIRGSMNGSQKGPLAAYIKPTSMQFMDGSKTVFAEERVLAKATPVAKVATVKQKAASRTTSSQEPVVTEYMPNYHQPVITSFGR